MEFKQIYRLSESEQFVQSGRALGLRVVEHICSTMGNGNPVKQPARANRGQFSSPRNV